MSITVDRTCTEIRSGGDGRVELGESRPLSAFGSLEAYVLLGDPGAGKTTEFGRECQALDGAAEYIRARDFIRLDLESHPEWRDRMLFIDGLDEMRAGAADSRLPLDEIRNRLERLNLPRFRISCREADWLGNNDRRNLESVSPGGSIAVLRLDPLSEKAAADLLSSLRLGVGVEEFIRVARLRGVGALLRNPLTLHLLADAVGLGTEWPASRLETFETACRRMATEQNEEHRAGVAPQPVETVLDAAGYLCALQLLSGIDGYSLAPGVESSAFVSLDSLEDAQGRRSRIDLEYALSTRLFTAVGIRTFVPVHRLVAEFLAGRCLAALIRNGLPARRVVALMTGVGDGRVVTVLRGLSAWLAALPGEARRQLIDADPVGIGIYGDIGGFTTEDKKGLLRSLTEFAAEAPLSGHQWRDGRTDEGRYDLAWAFRSLVSPDTATAINELLRTAGTEPSHDRISEFVLDLLSQADQKGSESLETLTSTIQALLLESATTPRVRRRALDAYLHLSPDGHDQTQTLIRVLEETCEGRLPDPDLGLCGTLLDRLYPGVVTPSRVWRYFPFSSRTEVPVGRMWQFWATTLMERSSDEHVAELLDALHEDAPRLIPKLDESEIEDLPIRLLERGLNALGEHVGPSRLDNWLSTVGRLLVTSLPGDRVRGVREWLEARPDTQKDLYLRWQYRRHSNETSSADEYWRCSALHESELPSDFGLWCLDQAIAISETNLAVAQELLSESCRSLRDPARSEGLTLDVLTERTHGRPELAHQVEELCRASSGVESADRGHNPDYQAAVDELEARRAAALDERRQRREEWSDVIRSHEAELRENRFSPPGLDALAKAYFGLFVGIDHAVSPRSRIAEFLGGDGSLVDIVMAGLREAATRDDVPAAEQTVSFHRESKHSWLAYPVLASLHLLNEEDPARLDGLDDALKRNALAIHYCVPVGPVSARWHGRWFQDDPELVLDVLYRCAVAALRAGDESPPGLNDLETVTGHDDLVHDMRLRLLRAFPIRAPNTQHRLLDRLLTAASQHPDKPALRALIERKLSSASMTVAQRVRWVAVESLLSPEPGLQALKAWVGENERRVRHLAEFFRNFSDRLGSIGDPAALKDIIEMLGCSYRPLMMNGLVTVEMDASDRISESISQLGSLASDAAQQALRDLIDNPQLAPWRGSLTRSLERQRVVHRDASYRNPTIERVQCTLSDQAPANVADLAALLVERLHDVSGDVRGGNSNPWRPFWNEDGYGWLTTPKPENSCRDSVLDALKERLPPEVDAAPEGRYAADRRADIRASRGAFNVPIEIKKNSHVDLWSALRSQLIGQYTTDPETGGYGIFLVLWFGSDVTKPPPNGNRPATPDELKRRLENDLTPDEARKVTVVVMDVTKP